MNAILRTKPEAEFFTPERCHILELLNTGDDGDCSIARARVEHGVTTQLHALRVAERYLVLSGTGSVEIDGQMMGDVGPLDVVQITAGVSQRITNTGKSDLVFLCICTPRFTPSAYVNLENTI